MRYAVINASTNAWEFEAKRLSEVVMFARSLRATGVECVIVKVIDDGSASEAPDIFEDV